MRIETKRLIITEFTPDMAESVHLNSLDEDNRRFVPDGAVNKMIWTEKRSLTFDEVRLLAYVLSY